MARNDRSKFHEMPTRMVTAAMAIASPSVVSTVRTGRCRTFLMIREMNRTDQSLAQSIAAVTSDSSQHRCMSDQDITDAPPDGLISETP